MLKYHFQYQDWHVYKECRMTMCYKHSTLIQTNDFDYYDNSTLIITHISPKYIIGKELLRRPPTPQVREVVSKYDRFEHFGNSFGFSQPVAKFRRHMIGRH